MELMPENVLPMHHTFSCEKEMVIFSRFSAAGLASWPPQPPFLLPACLPPLLRHIGRRHRRRRIKQNKITEKNEPLQDPSASPQLKRIRRVKTREVAVLQQVHHPLHKFSGQPSR